MALNTLKLSLIRKLLSKMGLSSISSMKRRTLKDKKKLLKYLFASVVGGLGIYLLGSFLASPEPLPLILGSTLGLFLILLGFRNLRYRYIISSTPTSKVRSMSKGFVELHGEAVPKDDVLESPYSGDNVLAYRLVLERYEEDDEGNSSWRRHTTSKDCVEFKLDDGTGEVLVEAGDAFIDMEVVSTNTMRRRSVPDALSTTRKSSRYRIHEYALKPGDETYVLGQAQPHDSLDSQINEDAKIGDSEDIPLFLVSHNDEASLIREYGLKSAVLISFGILIFTLLLL